MLPERLMQAIGQLPINESRAFAEMNDVYKTAMTISLASVNTASSWFIYRHMEGTVNTRVQKGMLMAFGTGLTVADAIVNHQIWT